MDKRTTLFLVITTCSFFLIQSLFFRKGEDAAIQKYKEQKAKEQQLMVQDVSGRVASMSQFPLTALYRDEAGAEFATNALQYGENYLITPFDNRPSVLYTKNGKKLSLSIKGDLGAPFLYTASEGESLASTYPPQIGAYDLQLVTLGQSPTVTLAVSEDNTLLFPSGKPAEPAIALYNFAGNYVPVGYYDSLKGRYEELTADIHFQEAITILKPKTTQGVQEQFYVLENEYQQIVFSNIGGSISEINLPFKSDKDNASVVLPVEADRIIAEKYSLNDRFPNNSYQIVDASGSRVQMQPTKGGYYPLLRRSIQGKNAFQESPRFNALTIQSSDPGLSALPFTMRSQTQNQIVFEATTSSRRITKTYSFPPENTNAPYVLDLSVRVDGDTRGLWLGSGIPEAELISGRSNPDIKVRSSHIDKVEVSKLSLPKKDSTTYAHMQPDWVSNSNGFFTLLLDPLTDIGPGLKTDHVPGNFDPSRLTIIDAEHNLYPAAKFPGYETFLPLAPTNQTQTFRFYAGPLESTVLKQVDQAYADQGYNPDYKSAISFHGIFSFISAPFAKFLFFVLNMIYQVVHSWGFSIILLTVFLRIMLYPLNAWSVKSTIRMQQLSPKIKAIQERYAKDPQRQKMEMMKLYKEGGANPLMGGCLPMLIQMPFLIGMFDLLKSVFALRGASFIPGWIDNLTAPDILFSWSTPIPFFGTSFHLLPFLLGGIMFLQQRMMKKLSGKKPANEQEKQAQNMGTIMAVVFTFLFYRFPSGLNLYWISSMSLSALQQWYTHKKMNGKSSPQKA
ncbi:MAG: membrane protein insertase YidC [Candidatus Algichlamydia australiensis]|nr:membrane protein insertase YidC [Chlamydiales bacterium]